ncbi:response regulator transcription factor [Lacrimispora saccharolytica]|uniref:Stage 0 sporulation protein A homolog n=1 Tax=Lacrimispora saccharolytica (strain ATCC 35040 / DSM 2544 / NRCC 2533 / WM1) TaxID=610130 RepID=D9R4U2_LACSW|nr:response regulator [Lacrimispora saccharolytica]ADL03276.1 two component transcriptional regulator, AraC family [[Clostridium] saccharolyticum WM1]QRV18556.1 response regulator [Lacrimispora saccharolytica]
MLRVLIAEDEDIIRKGLIYTTDWIGMGCVVVAEAANGQEGLLKILEHKPDVVIADICMPFMDGIEMIKEASRSVKFKSILLTSYAEFEYARRAIAAKVSEYLLKPVDEEKLAVLMKRLEEEITSSRQLDYVMEQAESEAGIMNLEYYMQLDLSENKYVSRAIEEIKTGYGDKLSVESISDKLGVSASYLSRKFKEVTGQTFLDFLNKYRISQAIVLLNTGQYRIGEVSDATGFTDYKHFCAVFKKYTLKSPSKFMKGV